MISSDFALFAIAALLAVGAASPAVAQTSGSTGEAKTGVETSSPSGQKADRTLRDRVTYLLGGYHFVPERETFDELAEPDELRATLRAIATDAEARPSLRMRAVDSLALYPNDDVRSFFESLADAPSEDLSDEERRVADLMRHHAITGLARITDGDGATVEAVEPYLTDEDFQVRLTAVAALGRHAGEPGAQRLRALATSVDDAVLRDEISRHISLPDGDNSGK